jgi:phosphoribosyl-ATP pyrophosphohydrolase/phosphoribosyl-AMP cyclohydrolase
MSGSQRTEIDFDKGDGLVPAIVQHAETGQVLMLGYVSRESLETTIESNRVTFFSRSRNELWTKGETSGNYLHYIEHRVDCDGDALLIQAYPEGPVCHTGATTCFVDGAAGSFGFLGTLEGIIDQRSAEGDESSYTYRLLVEGLSAPARKVGEEAVEVAIAALEESDERLKEETADLLYHLLVLLKARGLRLSDAVEVLRKRHARS